MNHSSDIPEQLGKYRIERILGQGAMGIVYQGFDMALQRQVAIKTVRAELLQHAHRDIWLARFRQEALAVGRCLHPNIVMVFDYGEAHSLPYIVLEYIDGQELKHYLRNKIQISSGVALNIIIQVLEGLDYAHRNA